MIPYSKEKIINAICFFAKEHKKRTRKPLYQTFLYKYLAFLEFKSLEETGMPVFGLEYLAMERGPVPIEIYKNRDKLKNNYFVFKKIGDDKYVIIPKKTPNLEYFSPYEIKKMKELIEIYAEKFITSDDISEASHQDIKQWRKAWNRKPNSIVKYDYSFDEDIENKTSEELNAAEEKFLIFKALRELERLKI